MQWIVLGSGTAVPHPTKGSAAHLLRAGNRCALFDSGSGTKDRLAHHGIRLGDVTHFIYTHAHLDHFGDLFALLFYRMHADDRDRVPGLVIAGPAPLISVVRDVCSRIDRDLIERNHDVTWTLVEPLRPLDGGWFQAEAYRVDHGRQVANAYRITCEEGTLCYSGDTTTCDGLDQAARRVDCLVCECSFPDHMPRKNHMTPSSVRQLADRSEVSTVVLTHLYPELLAARPPGDAFDGFSGEVHVAEDGTCVDITVAGVRVHSV